MSEGGLSTAAEPTDLSTGNPGPGETTSSDEAAGTGASSLASLFSVGADEPGVIGFGNSVSGLPALLSKGQLVTYALTDTNADGTNDTLTATAGGRTVFTLHVNADGTWTFDLDDQLDHVLGGGENTALQLSGGGSVTGIDFSALPTKPSRP